MKMKKKLKKIIGVIAAIFVGFVLYALISDSGSPAKPTTEEESQQEVITEDVENDQLSEVDTASDIMKLDAIDPDKDKEGKYLHVGRTYTSKDGSIDIKIIEAGFDTSNPANEMNSLDILSGKLYLVTEITNNRDTDIRFDQNDALLFVDDYEVSNKGVTDLIQDNGYVFIDGDRQFPTVADIRAGGRKGTVIFVTFIDSTQGITEDSDIEFEISGASFKANPSYILQRFDELAYVKDKKQKDPFTDTNPAEGSPIDKVDGVYLSDDESNNVVIIVSGDKVSVQSSGSDIENANLWKNITENVATGEIYNEYMFFDGNEDSVRLTFFGNSKMYTEGTLYGGWFHEKDGKSGTGTTTSITSTSTGIVYGTYSCSPNTIGGENIAYVYFTTDEDGGDFIMIDSYEADDEGMPNNFGGDIVENGNSYSVTGASGKMLSITFVDGGMNVEVLSGDSIEEFAGYYKLDEELDLNSVS